MTKQEPKPSYKLVHEKKFGFKKLVERLGGKRNPEQDQNIQEAMKEWPEDLKVVVGKADEELLSGKSAVVEIGGVDGLAVKDAMETYNQNYGKLPNDIYTMALGEVPGYLRAVTEEYIKCGISTLSEIEVVIKERRQFVGPHAKGTLEDGCYRIYVADGLIYDEKKNAFDSEWKRLQIYTEIQKMIATHIYHKDLKTIRSERKKARLDQ